MNFARTSLLIGLSALCGSALAGDEPAIRSVDNVVLYGAEDPTTEKVYIVQLASPSAAEVHAKLTRSNLTIAKSISGARRPSRFEKNTAAMQSYTAKLANEQRNVLQKIGSGAQQIYSYKYGLNGFAARMSVAQAEKLASLPEVLNVWEDEIRPLATSHSASFLKLFDRDAGLRSQQGLDGDGMVIAVIDSGIAPDNPGLADTRPADRPRLCRSSWAETSILGQWLCKRFDKRDDIVEFEAPENWNGECVPGDRFETSDCNNKLIGARWFIDGAVATGPIDAGEFSTLR